MSEEPYTFLCVDLETTATEPVGEGNSIAGVVEIGATGLTFHQADGCNEVGETKSILCSPGMSITPETSAVHGYTDEDVAGIESGFLLTWDLHFDPEPGDWFALVAHNAAFERKWIRLLAAPETPWICTHKCALSLWPDAPAHSLGTLVYWLLKEGKLPGFDRTKFYRPHRAGPDTYANAHLLAALLKEAIPEDLVEISERPVLLAKVPFGQHRGKKWADMDPGFLSWVLARDFSEDVLYTAKYWYDWAYA